MNCKFLQGGVYFMPHKHHLNGRRSAMVANLTESVLKIKVDGKEKTKKQSTT